MPGWPSGCATPRSLAQANDRLWWGIHPDGLAAVYAEHPAAIDVAFAESRSEVLGAPDPLAAVQQVHCSIHRAFIAYQTAADERRALAADTGETIREFVDALIAAGWTEQQARNADVHQLAHASAETHPPGHHPATPQSLRSPIEIAAARVGPPGGRSAAGQLRPAHEDRPA